MSEGRVQKKVLQRQIVGVSIMDSLADNVNRVWRRASGKAECEVMEKKARIDMLGGAL